jgi:hypothetical protein
MALPQPLARIFLPPRAATQSGRAGSQEWVLSFAPRERRRIDPLTGWSGSGDMLQQVELRFPTREAAVAYAKARGVSYAIEEPPPAKPIRPKIYADNFRYGRLENWSH